MTENEIAEKEKEIVIASENLNLVQEELYRYRKQMVELRNKVSDLYEGERKAKYMVSKLKMEAKILTRQFWANKNP